MIAQEAVSHPYAIEVEAESLSDAMTAATKLKPEKVSLAVSFVVDMDSRKVMRVIKNSEGRFTARDSAYNKIGILTPPESLEGIGNQVDEGQVAMPAPEPEVSTMEIPE